MMELQPYLELFTDFIGTNFKTELQTTESLKDITDIMLPH